MPCKHTRLLRAIGDYYVCADCALAVKYVRKNGIVRLVPVKMPKTKWVQK